MYSCVLVPLDGSELSGQALPYAKMVAKSTGATLVLLRAVNSYPRELVQPGLAAYRRDDGGMPTSEEWDEVRGKINAGADDYLERMAASVADEGLQVETALREGSPEEVIMNEAAKDAGTLVAMATHGRSGVGRWLMGSVTDRIVRGGENPTLVIRAHEDRPDEVLPLNRVVITVDGSSVSESAEPHAVAMAKALGVGVTVLRAVPPSSYGETFAEFAPSAYAQHFNDEVKSEAQGYVDEKIREIKALGIEDVNGRVADSQPGNAILDEVGEEGDELVVMATRGLSGVGRWLMGSVTDKVIRHSPGPVLVVREKADE